MLAIIVDSIVLSLMFTLFFIGYSRNGTFEGLRLASYAGLITTLTGMMIYIAMNHESFKLISYHPSSHKIQHVGIQPEAYSALYSFGILFIISIIMIGLMELYVRARQPKGDK